MNVMTFEEIRQAAGIAENEIGRAESAVVLGSGLGDYGNTFEKVRRIPFTALPGFPASTAPGHAGEFISGEKQGRRVLIMSGRLHYYEGIRVEQIALPVRVLRLLGVKNLILTNAAGGINHMFNPGELMMITDYINLTGQSPLIGPNIDEMGPRFPDMTHVFTPALQDICRNAAQAMGLTLREGVYCWMSGPCYETPAEIRMLRTLGADAVGMSTVPDAMAACHAGMNVLGISCITNMAAGIVNRPITHAEVLETGRRIQASFRELIDRVIVQL